MGSFSATHWVILGVICFVLFKLVKGSSSPGGKDMFCKACGHSGETTTLVRGNFLIEVILWLCFLVPGLIYSIWRLSTKAAKCPKCGSVDLVPPDSPVALAAKKQLGI